MGLQEHSWTFDPPRDSHGWGWMVRGLDWALGSGWGLGKATGRMGKEDVKRQQKLKRRRREEKEEATPVIQYLPVLRMHPLDS